MEQPLSFLKRSLPKFVSYIDFSMVSNNLLVLDLENSVILFKLLE